MEKEKLDRTHVGLQFLMMMLSLLSFLILACFVGEIVWITDFQYFVVLISGVFAIFIGLIALLRYYTQKANLIFLLLGIGFLAVGLLDIVQLVIDVGGFETLFVYRPGEVYPFSAILSRGFLSLILFLSWLSAERIDNGESLIEAERRVVLLVVTLFISFSGVVSYFILSNVISESLWVVMVGTATLMLLLLSFVGHMFRKGWKYDNFAFWLIFAISFLILSQIFFLPFLNIEYYSMVNLSIWAKFFSYLALLTGFLNSIYEMYQRELLTQRELERKNRLLDETKKKVEEAYLVVRKEKWDLVRGKKKSTPVKKKSGKGSKK